MSESEKMKSPSPVEGGIDVGDSVTMDSGKFAYEEALQIVDNIIDDGIFQKEAKSGGEQLSLENDEYRTEAKEEPKESEKLSDQGSEKLLGSDDRSGSEELSDVVPKGSDQSDSHSEGSEYSNQSEGDQSEGSLSEDHQSEGSLSEDAYTKNAKAMLADAEAEEIHLTQENRKLIKQLVPILLSKQDLKTDEGQENMDQARNIYLKRLKEMSQVHQDFTAKQDDVNHKITNLSAKLEDEDAKASELRAAFRQFKREIARSAVNSRTGRAIPQRRILQFESEEERLDKNLESERLKNIHFSMQLKKLESRVSEKEKLADGLHLIDFEQLKIENQTLNEKIEERNDELHKLRKKTTTTVQVLTHIKEKLQFVEAENGILLRQQDDLDQKVGSLRDQLTKSKRNRDRFRRENQKLKSQQGFVGSDILVVDYEERARELEKLEEQVEFLQTKHHQLSRTILRGKIALTDLRKATEARNPAWDLRRDMPDNYVL